MKEKLLMGKGVRIVLGLVLWAVMCLIIMPVTAFADTVEDAEVIQKDYLIMINETNASGPILIINDEILVTNDDIVLGYLNGYSEWIYTSAAGVVSTFDGDSIVITEALYGGTIYYKVYSEDMSYAWISSEISLRPVLFNTQPVGGIGNAGEPYTIKFDIASADYSVYLWEYSNRAGWICKDKINQGETSYGIPYGNSGEVTKYKLSADIGGVQVFTEVFEVAWMYDIFKLQPVSGASEGGKPYTITFASYASDSIISLEKYNSTTGKWDRQKSFEKGTTTYDIPYGTPGKTECYRLVLNGTTYGREFQVAWAEIYTSVKKQPVGGTGEPGQPYTITFEIDSKGYDIYLDKYYEASDNWARQAVISDGQTSYDIPYGTPGTTDKYVIRINNKPGTGIYEYSNEFEVTWGIDYFKTKPVGGTSEPGRPYTITFSHCLNNTAHYVSLYKYNTTLEEWVNQINIYGNQTTYDIPFGTPGATDRYRLEINNGAGNNVNVCSDEFEVTWGTEMFVTQPIGGRHPLNEDHRITFAVKDYAEGATFLLQAKSGSNWGNIRHITSPYMISAYSFEYTATYRLMCTYNSKYYYSDEFTVEWFAERGPFEDSIGERLEGYSLNLYDNIGIDFYMELAEAVKHDSGARFVIQLPDDSRKEIPVSDAMVTWVGEKRYYVFECRVDAKQMTDTIKAKIVLGDGTEGTEYQFTVQDYAKYILDHESEYSFVFPIVKAMLNYGTAAQNYFDYNTDKPANEILSEADRASTLPVPEPEYYDYMVPEAREDISFIGTALLLDSEVSLKCYFKSTADLNAGNTSVKLWDSELSAYDYQFGRDGDLQYVLLTGISPTEYSNEYTIEARGLTVENVSVYGYMAKVFACERSNDALVEVLKSMYAYGEACTEGGEGL